jgi:hypothetical protein
MREPPRVEISVQRIEFLICTPRVEDVVIVSMTEEDGACR